MGRVAEMVDPHCAHISKGAANKQLAPPRRKARAPTAVVDKSTTSSLKRPNKSQRSQRSHCYGDYDLLRRH